MKIAVAGAGLSGATVAERLRDAGHDVTVFDKRNHVAGNAFDYAHRTGVLVHRYGPHIFHTKNKNVFDYLKQFTYFEAYEHRVSAITERGYVPFPPNVNTMKVFKREELIDTFYRPYTELMWAEPLEKISPKILDRVPMREDDEDRYFPNDTYQGMPKDGYTKMVERMLAKCKVHLSTQLVPADFGNYDHVIYCGSPDALFFHRVGRLPYRTIDFTSEEKPLRGGIKHLLPTTTVNFAGDLIKLIGRTRVTEWNHFPNNPNPSKELSLVTFETPRHCFDGEGYYPIRNEDSLKLYDTYADYVEKVFPNVTLLGRCGNFVYIDMDQAVNMGLALANKILKKGS